MTKGYLSIALAGLIIFSLMQIISADVNDEFKFTISPQQPNPGDAITLKVINKTGETIKRVIITVYDPNLDVIYDSFVSGGVLGLSTYDTKHTGLYKVSVSGYAGSFNFSVKKDLWYAGPNPSNPVVGEKITLGVPKDVGVKVYDAQGNVYLACKTEFDSFGNGRVTFTVDKSGKYTLKLAEISSTYWEKNISLIVYDRKKFNVEITPEKPIPEQVVTIKLKSEGSPVDNAEVVITTPSGKTETKTSSLDGKVPYLPTEIGDYTVHIEKEKYEPTEEKFSVYNSFKVTVNPEEVGVGEFVTVDISDQKNNDVNDANFYILSKNINQTTSSDEEVKFSISDAGSYEFVIEKFGFWTLKQNLTVLLLSNLRINPESAEIGNPVKLETFSSSTNEKISSTKKITKPSGAVESITGEEYVPNEVGTYYVIAKNQNYKSANGTSIVIPRPLELGNKIVGKTITISVHSHTVPVAGIVVVVETPTDTKTLVTNENGTAEFEVQEGEFRVYGNFNKRNSLYEEKIMGGFVKKEYSFATLLLIILIILLCATVAITKPWKTDESGGRLFIPKKKKETAIGKTVAITRPWKKNESEGRLINPKKNEESGSDKKEESSIGKV